MIRLAAMRAMFVAAILAGCGNSGDTLRMIPAPIVVQDPRLDFFQRVAPENRRTTVPVLYATSRAPAPAGAVDHYLRYDGEVVRLGSAQVELGEPGWTFDDLVASDRSSRADNLRPARVPSVEELGVLGRDADRAFVEAIDRQVQASPTGEVVLYVPGYRATFNQVMALMGGWAHYLGRATPVIAFRLAHRYQRVELLP